MHYYWSSKILLIWFKFFFISSSCSDNLVIVDDSIVRGTTLQKSILKMLNRLSPKKIIVVSSAPQIRYPDCYGIDMAIMEGIVTELDT